MAKPFAVLLNANAKRVSGAIREMVSEVVDPEDIYYSSSQEESGRITQQIVDKGYSTVFAGGGDGTVIDFMDRISRYPAAQRPMVGILMLGTGNAMARMVSSGYILEDLKSFSVNASRDGINLALLEAENRRFTFGGLGIDAEILNDYRDLKSRHRSGLRKSIAQSLGGYFFSFIFKTLPRLLRRQVFKNEVTVKVTALAPGNSAITFAGEGRTYAEGEVLYEGKAIVAMVGTVPYYGYGMKVMPFAGKDPARAHLRVGSISMWRAIFGFHKLWNGTYEGPGIHDFLITAVRVETDRPMPYQVGGDAADYRQQVDFVVVPEAIKLVHLF